MPMPPYPLHCYRKGCGQLAIYKIAARWSDGVTSELKTYALSCEACLPEWFRLSRQKQAACRLTTAETLEPPGIYRMERGQRDKKLERLSEREAELPAIEVST
ncbi:MAG: hypothetical protein K2R98_24230 [Gemmataceae bacterium]|nr:hypothetical protein [Gemmataceae bacterium]